MNLMIPEHSQHCRLCKERVRDLLTVLYGDCRANYSFRWSAKPRDYNTASIGRALQRICAALEELRGHRDFIKSAQVPPCDFYISSPPFIVEFDESQHFTHPRLVALDLYPENITLGFPLERWQALCREIDARDDEPFDRDERRAWYDTLRDLVPTLHGFEPTVRLYAGEFVWCSLDRGSSDDLEEFRAILEARLPVEAMRKP